MFRSLLFASIACTLITLLLIGAPVRADKDPASPAPKPLRYTITDLGTLGNDGFSGACALNENGQIVGWSGTNFDKSGLRPTHAFLWQDGHMEQIGLPADAPYPTGYRINNQGQVLIKPILLCNGFYNGPFPDYTYVWQPGEIKQTAITQAVDFSGKDQIVANSQLMDAPAYRAGVVLWEGDKQILSLSAPAGYTQAFAYGSNDNGQIVGEVVHYDVMKRQSTDQRPFLYGGGKMSLLDVPGDMVRGKAVAINRVGEVLIQGWSKDNRRGAYAVLWRNGKLTDLDRGGKFSPLQASNLNDKGQVVGSYWTSETMHAFLWQNDQVTDLNRLLPSGSDWKLLTAVAINNKGWIIGDGLHNGIARAYLLKPAEPRSVIIYVGVGSDNPNGGVVTRIVEVDR